LIKHWSFCSKDIYCRLMWITMWLNELGLTSFLSDLYLYTTEGASPMKYHTADYHETPIQSHYTDTGPTSPSLAPKWWPLTRKTTGVNFSVFVSLTFPNQSTNPCKTDIQYLRYESTKLWCTDLKTLSHDMLIHLYMGSDNCSLKSIAPAVLEL